MSTPEYQSKLDNIFLAVLFNADDRASYGNAKAFRPLVEEFTLMAERGIEVEERMVQLSQFISC